MTGYLESVNNIGAKVYNVWCSHVNRLFTISHTGYSTAIHAMAAWKHSVPFSE